MMVEINVNTLFSLTATKTGPEQDDTTDKLFYLSCGFCRWTSRDIGLPDQQQSSGEWPEIEFENANKVSMDMNSWVYFCLLLYIITCHCD